MLTSNQKKIINRLLLVSCFVVATSCEGLEEYEEKLGYCLFSYTDYDGESVTSVKKCKPRMNEPECEQAHADNPDDREAQVFTSYDWQSEVSCAEDGFSKDCGNGDYAAEWADCKFD